MSTNLAEIANQLPEDIRAQLAKQITEDVSRLGATGGKDFIIVSQNKTFELPNEQNVTEFEAHIVDFMYRNEYYLSKYNRKVQSPPACFAINEASNSLTPDKDSPKAQSTSDCASCQWNQFGSNPENDGKACKNTVLLALLPTDKEVATHDIWVLKLSPTAIKHFNKFVATLSQMNIPLNVAKVKIFFDPNSDWASVRCEAVGVAPEHIEVLASRRKEANTRLQRKPDTSTFENPKS